MKSARNILHLGMDVHQETIAVAIASGEGSVRHYGEIPGQLQAVDTLIKKLQKPGTELRFCHEAGLRGFVLSRRRKHRERKKLPRKNPNHARSGIDNPHRSAGSGQPFSR